MRYRLVQNEESWQALKVAHGRAESSGNQVSLMKNTLKTQAHLVSSAG